MFKKLFTISLLLAFFASFTVAQNEQFILKPNGEKTRLADADTFNDALIATKVTTFRGEVATSVFAKPTETAVGLADSLGYTDLGTFPTPFVYYDQDVMLMWFEAPADINIKGIGVATSRDGGSANTTVSVKLVKLNWTADQMKNFGAAAYQGYYPSDNDGMNNADPFGEEATGSWVVGDSNNVLPPWTNNADPALNTFEYDLWSDGGFGWPITPAASAAAATYQWVNTIDLGFEPSLVKGDVFAVVAVNDGTSALYDNEFGTWADNSLGIPGWKYYEAGRMSEDEPGWWVRMYTWDLAVAVEVTSDLPPTISDLTKLGTVLSTDARTVEANIVDTNPGGGDAGVATANLVYTTNGGDPVSLAMTASGDVYSANIPGQSPGTDVVYWIDAVDVLGLESQSQEISYSIFEALYPTLLLINGGVNYIPYYYGYADSTFVYDIWNYGGASTELLDKYTNVIELTANNSGPSWNNNDLVAAWLAGDGSRNYALIGDEYLGVHSGWTDGAHEAGSFMFDVLGITYEYNDVNYDGDVVPPSILEPVENSELGGNLFTTFATNNPGDTLWYDPAYEIGGANFLDGADVTDDSEVDMYGYGLDGTQYNVAAHRELPAGNKVAFMLYDVLSVDSQNPYNWYSADRSEVHYELLEWWGVASSVGEEGTLPKVYTLSQNYPNPFNPTTVISYSIPEKSDVTLKVFNLLGQEVATLFSGVKNSGSHQANFNANNLSSGVYFYTIKAGSFTSTKKMMLIK